MFEAGSKLNFQKYSVSSDLVYIVSSQIKMQANIWSEGGLTICIIPRKPLHLQSNGFH